MKNQRSKNEYIVCFHMLAWWRGENEERMGRLLNRMDDDPWRLTKQ